MKRGKILAKRQQALLLFSRTASRYPIPLFFTLSYTQNVNAVPNVDDRKQWKYYFGGMLCCLLLVYAVGAKLALYHLQQPGAKSVAATKAWQDNAIPSIDVEIAPIHAVPSTLYLVAIILSLTFTAVWRIIQEEPVRAMPRWFSPHLSVRPPPTL